MQNIYFILTLFLALVLFRFVFRRFLGLPRYRGKVITDNYTGSDIMQEKLFWQLISESRKDSRRNYEAQCKILTSRLSNLNEEEIMGFDATMRLLMARSYSFRLWEPVYALNGGCSDDCFEYFRTWLIAQGRDNFYWTTRFPRLLFFVGVKESIENYEGLGYCAYDAYQIKMGHEFPEKELLPYDDPGRKFSEGKAVLRYPELALLAW
jgi:hypothetical protein